MMPPSIFAGVTLWVRFTMFLLRIPLKKFVHTSCLYTGISPPPELGQEDFGKIKTAQDFRVHVRRGEGVIQLSEPGFSVPPIDVAPPLLDPVIMFVSFAGTTACAEYG